MLLAKFVACDYFRLNYECSVAFNKSFGFGKLGSFLTTRVIGTYRKALDDFDPSLLAPKRCEVKQSHL